MTDPASPTPPPAVTLAEIQELIRSFESSGRAGLELEWAGFHLVLRRDGPPAATGTMPASASVAPMAAVQTVPAPQGESLAPPGGIDEQPPEVAGAAEVPPGRPVGGREHLVEVRSPAVGAFWTAPGPGQPAFVEVGQVVAAGEQLAIVEVMKLMSHVSAPVPGTIIEVCTTNSAFVEFDEVLFLIEPEHA